MDTLRNRFASSQDIVLVFASVVTVIYSWSILMFFERLPSWLLHIKFWDVIGILAYTQTFALLESVLVLLVLMLLGALLPAQFFRKKFVAQGSMVIFLTSVWAIAIQNNNMILIRSATRTTFLVWSVLYLTSLAVPYLLIHRYKRLEEAINSFIERLTVLLYVYVSVAGLSIIIVMIRNVF